MKPDYRHAYRIFLVIGLVGAGAVIAKFMAVPDTYGQYGPFRGKALAAARDRAPRHQGNKACLKCHPKQSALHDKDAHKGVSCEVCHGAGLDHAVMKKGKIKKPQGKAFCLACHQELTARPGAFPQIDWKDHYAFVGVKKDETPCTTCHDPHEPLYMDRDLRTARLHPVIQRCRDCHAGSTRDERMQRPAGHPAIFECSYCHKEVATDFAARPHKKVRCTTCHIFFKESEFAGRILRDADPRFCLLCHRAGDFRSDKGPPAIEWPGHRDDVSSGPEDAAKRCIDCHKDKIHQTGGGKKSDG